MATTTTDPDPGAAKADPRIVMAQVVLGVLGVVISVLWVHGVYTLLQRPDYAGEAIDNDFSVFWAAARLAVDGQWLAPFDVDTLGTWRSIPPGREDYEMIWFYPPGYLLAIYPLGKLSFFWAWLVFCAVSLAAFVAAIWTVARDVPGALIFLVFAPVTMLVLALGHNPLIFSALTILALEAIRRDRPILAGLALAAMTLKPQLGLAIPFALVAAGYWRVTLWACLFTAAMVAVTLAFPGPDYWQAFFDGLVEGSHRLRNGAIEPLMISTYGAAVVGGLPQQQALWLQGAVSLTALAAIVWLWRSRARFEIKAAGLCIGTLLVTPYAIYYEMMFALAGALYLVRDRFGATRPQALLLVALWAAPVLGTLSLPSLGFVFVAPLLILTFAVTLGRARQVGAA